MNGSDSCTANNLGLWLKQFGLWLEQFGSMPLQVVKPRRPPSMDSEVMHPCIYPTTRQAPLYIPDDASG